MPDYDLHRLSPRSFEQLIQALATKIIGPGTVVFGDGPDGGREATYEGAMMYPSERAAWDGYLVLQAKFRQRPVNAGSDGNWATKQLEGEIEKLTNPKRRLRKPEYYIFCTNVVLSPVEKVGYKDRVHSVLRDFAAANALKGFAVWDYDQLRAYVDGAEEIRNAYAGWITSGDVLRKLMAGMEVEPDFHQTIGSFLAGDLLDDRYARLDQAGHNTQELTPMARLFIDLPFSDSAAEEPPAETQTELKSGFLSELLAAGAERLDAESVRTLVPNGSLKPDGAFGRYVLVGGPGQGKTTIGQFACQLYRAGILIDRPNLAPEVRDAVAALHHYCHREKLAPPTGRRFPIRIVLNEFARSLAESKADSLLTYISTLVAARSHRKVTNSTLEKWLRLHPSFLVLDGLDEVPASTNRDEVIGAVTRFIVFAHEAGADMLVLATTRPQGYNSDFAPKYYRHRYLTPLSIPRAMHYGTRLASVTHGDDTTMAREVIENLKLAAENEATARLMRSPLQVTIMAVLVARGGPAPQERWVLFRKYYNVIYDRESAKRLGEITAILRSSRTHIDAIHYRVGLLLQILSERKGQTNARLTKTAFAKIVRDRLAQEGQAGEAAENLSALIIQTASERLVFLVGVRQEEIGFEIRSLQEFMAAEALMDGADISITDRLAAIAPISHWNNVFLFAAGKCFFDRPHLRHVVQDICAGLNERSQDDDLRHYGLIGSQLALSLLEDGVARQQWTFEQVLARTACRLRTRPPSTLQDRLGSAYHVDIDGVYQDELVPQKDMPGAWSVILHLADRGVQWAIAAATESKPTPSNVEVLMSSAGAWGACRRELAASLIALATPQELQQMQRTYQAQFRSWPTALLPAKLAFLGDRISAHLQRVRGERDAKVDEVFRSAQPWADASLFLRDPRAATLATLLRSLADYWAAVGIKPDRIGLALPWVASSVVSAAQEAAELRAFAGRALDGDFGDIDRWNAAERRWSTASILMQDLHDFEANALLPIEGLAHTGFPFTAVHSWNFGMEDETPELARAAVRVWRAVRSRPLREWFARIALSGRRGAVVSELDVSSIVSLIRDFGRGIPDYVGELSDEQQRADDVVAALDELGIRLANEGIFDPRVLRWLLTVTREAATTVGSGRSPAVLWRMTLAHPDKKGLLQLLGQFSILDASVVVSRELLSLCDMAGPPASILLRVGADLNAVELAALECAVLNWIALDERRWLEILCRIKQFLPRQRTYERFVAVLYEHCPSSLWHMRQEIVRLIDECLSTRSSELHVVQQQAFLKLPFAGQSFDV